MATRARRRDSGSAERLRALTRRAYLASNGHLDLDEQPTRPDFDDIVRNTEPPPTMAGSADGPIASGTPDARPAADAPRPRRVARGERLGGQRPPAGARWGATPRAVLAAVLVLAALAGVLVARSLLHTGAAQPLPLQAEQTTDERGGDASEPGTQPGPAEPPELAPPVTTTPAPATAEPSAAEPPRAGPATAGTAGGHGSEVLVHVAGQVAEPGVVVVADGSRVADVIERAGGATRQAELDAVNLARVVVDGEQVYVPAAGEAGSGQLGAGEAGAPGGGAPAAGAGGPAPGGVVDLNGADQAALETLPGVGPAIAQRILEWRAANGGFHTVDELIEVSGIGPATMERLRPLVTA